MTDNDWPDAEQQIAAAHKQGYRAGVERGLIAGLTAARTAVGDLLADPLPADGLVEQNYTIDTAGEEAAAVNEALTRGAARIHQAIVGPDGYDCSGFVDQTKKTPESRSYRDGRGQMLDLIQHYTRADDETMIRLCRVCDRIDDRTIATARPRGEAMPAALELVKAGVSIQEIIDTHLIAAADLAEALRCTLVDAGLLVARASAAFRLDARSIQFLPAFVKQVKDT
jgi:hypothetical protein